MNIRVVADQIRSVLKQSILAGITQSEGVMPPKPMSSMATTAKPKSSVARKPISSSSSSSSGASTVTT